MQRKSLMATVLLAVAAALVVGWRSFSPGQEQVPTPEPCPFPAASQTNAYLGVGSCAAPACHGGPDSAENDKQRGKWNSAYTVWVEKDPPSRQPESLHHSHASAMLGAQHSK